MAVFFFYVSIFKFQKYDLSFSFYFGILVLISVRILKVE